MLIVIARSPENDYTRAVICETEEQAQIVTHELWHDLCATQRAQDAWVDTIQAEKAGDLFDLSILDKSK